MGLVNRVLPAHMLPAYAEDYSRRIAENAPLTMGSIKAITQDLQKPESERIWTGWQRWSKPVLTVKIIKRVDGRLWKSASLSSKAGKSWHIRMSGILGEIYVW